MELPDFLDGLCEVPEQLTDLWQECDFPCEFPGRFPLKGFPVRENALRLDLQEADAVLIRGFRHFPNAFGPINEVVAQRLQTRSSRIARLRLGYESWVGCCSRVVRPFGGGPYLVLPFMEPLTVRDGIGKVIDRTIDPLTYVVPLIPALSLMAGNRVNERALNYELFAAFDDDVIDAYSAVRNGYLRLRERRVNE